jgi:hypothetical protein
MWPSCGVNVCDCLDPAVCGVSEGEMNSPSEELGASAVKVVGAHRLCLNGQSERLSSSRQVAEFAT